MLAPMIENPTRTVSIESGIETNDDLLIQRIYSALRHLNTLIPVTVALHIDVEEGMVVLGGVVENETIRQQILADVWSVPGVKAVQDELSVGFDLEFKIIRTLMTDPRTSQWATNITVTTIAETVFLGGQVPTLDVARTAEVIVAAMPGIQEVCNHLRIVPDLEMTEPISSILRN